MVYPKKYIWGSVLLEQELKKIQQKIREEQNVRLLVSDISHRLGEDLRNGKIKMEIPIFRFNNANFIKLEGKKEKRKNV